MFNAQGHSTHWHTLGQFLYAAIGSAQVLIGDRSFDVTPNRALWIPAGIRHSARFSADLVPIVCNIDADLGDLGSGTALNVGPDLRAALLTWHREPDERRSTEFRSTLLGRLRQPGPLPLPLQIPDGRLTGPIAARLLTCPSDPRTIAHWAPVLHSSSASVRRAFRAETGLSFTQWRTVFRLNASLPLLVDGTAIATAAHRVGFESTNGYTMAFRRHFGCTPSSFARSDRAAEAPSDRRRSA